MFHFSAGHWLFPLATARTLDNDLTVDVLRSWIQYKEKTLRKTHNTFPPFFTCQVLLYKTLCTKPLSSPPISFQTELWHRQMLPAHTQFCVRCILTFLLSFQTIPIAHQFSCGPSYFSTLSFSLWVLTLTPLRCSSTDSNTVAERVSSCIIHFQHNRYWLIVIAPPLVD